jgi:RES domain-containing protein
VASLPPLHPRHTDIEQWIRLHASGAAPFRGVLYRTAGPRHTTPAEWIDGNGGLAASGRWNRRGAFRVVYTSMTAVTAMIESTQTARRTGIPTTAAFPKVTVEIEVALDRVLDLTLAGLTPPVALTMVLGEEWDDPSLAFDTLGQSFGRAAYAVGLQGLMVPSAVDPTGTNVLEHFHFSCCGM